MQSRGPLFLIVVVVLAALSIWGYMSRPYAFGLDVKGGVRLTYELDASELSTEQQRSMESVQADVVRIMEGRVGAALGVVEGTVAKKGIDQIIVELPGYTDIGEAQETLSTTAKIVLYHARNVSNEKTQKVYSRSGEEKTEQGVPYVTFTRLSSPTVLKPGDAAYADMIKGWEKLVEGADIADARPFQASTSQVVPQFSFTASGEAAMQAWSRKFNTSREQLAFVLDGRVLSIASIKDGAILGNGMFIDGQFEPGYVRRLTEMVKAGALPVSLKELASEKVDPTIGAKALDQIVLAGLVSFGLICVFLIVYYSFPGVIAALAMGLYALFTITLLKLIGATFSLAAIAGLVLSVGMAVDANVLVFERLKEEIRAGRSIVTAIEISFKRALNAIIDSNVATICTSIVLWWLGTGAVKGFATTLIVGVLVSFFTAVIITRVLVLGLVGVGVGLDAKWYALNRNWFGEKLEQSADSKPLDIVGKANRYFLISGGIMVFGLIFVAIGGIKPNVEFQGGYEGVFIMTPGQEKTAAQIRQAAQIGGIKDVNVKFGEGKNGRLAYLTVPFGAGLDPAQGTETNPTTNDELAKKLATASGLNPEGASFTRVGPTVQAETVRNAILGILISSGLIVLWLAIRFGVALGGLKNGIKFGMSAVAALAHDIVVVIGTAGVVGFLLGWEISALFITAMLTVASFSVHDTIVIFDRIRENLRRQHKGETFENLVNRSITQSIARSINTSFTAVVPLVVLIAIGTPTPELKFMCVAMLAGIVTGTFSSIFNAAPILYLWDRAVIKRRGEEAGLMAESEAAAKQAALLAAQAGQAAMAAGGPTEEGKPASGQYGTVKRRSSVAQKSQTPLDED